ncbi:neprosin family prolyl endopeptidase [Actinoplanes sp. LDG1-01]|uniref:Neprosin family prolyl endopeptidase n=1 Tax=Paractinoplanes lichenicola TaxID=2802976 RepID=A0ABS1VSN8_9ACTN|nr:neprosin family prolyl endopeptidase [Actinoplanes lichenicola]
MVGAIGVASTVNAGADQIESAPEASASAGAPDAAGADAPNATDAPSPTVKEPPKLPWGDRPKTLKRGKPGASSNSLKAQGLSAAPADASGSVIPVPEEGPKGRITKSGPLRSEMTDAVPPKPLGLKAAESKVNYMYNVGSQSADTAGVYSNITIGKPELDRDDYHTLAEIALQSADGKQIVEVGWTVDRLVNGDDDPHLFVFHWINGEAQCYNGCGWVQADGAIKPGATLTYGVTKKFGIQYYDKGWWVAYDTEWIGYFPEEIWNKQGVKFNRSGLVQVFGEVAAAASKTATCTDMGNGTLSSKENAARVSSVSFIEGPTVDMFIRSTAEKTYPIAPISARSFRYGGPGDC